MPGEGDEADTLGLFRLGQCLRETGAKGEAKEILQRFLALTPEAHEALRDRVAAWIRELE
jgi:hypothetical protein